MKKTKSIKMYLAPFIFLILMSVFVLTLNAASSISNSKTQKELFAVPEGGWSSVNLQAEYRETYNRNGSNSNFTRRTKSIVWQRAAATSTPQITLGHVSHSTGKSFTSWKRESMYINPKWDGGALYSNSTKVTYPASTSAKGTFYYTIYCPGAITPTRAGSVSLSLKTK